MQKKSKTITTQSDSSTEEKILNAARKLFIEKGFEGTKTREIAEEAGINLALLNYYFRSKAKLFSIIMEESVRTLFQSVVGVINNEDLSIEEKTELLVENYINTLLKQPNIPIFVLNELGKNPNKLFKTMAGNSIFETSHLNKQLKSHFKNNKIKDAQAIDYFLNLISLTVFPFVAAPMVKKLTGIPDEDFEKLMNQRKKMIPIWLKTILP